MDVRSPKISSLGQPLCSMKHTLTLYICHKRRTPTSGTYDEKHPQGVRPRVSSIVYFSLTIPWCSQYAYTKALAFSSDALWWIWSKQGRGSRGPILWRAIWIRQELQASGKYVSLGELAGIINVTLGDRWVSQKGFWGRLWELPTYSGRIHGPVQPIVWAWLGINIPSGGPAKIWSSG